VTGPEVQRLSPAGRSARLLVALAVVTGLVLGAAVGTDRLYPFAPMTQFAYPHDPNSTIYVKRLWADTTAGQHVAVPLRLRDAGIRSEEFNLLLPDIVAHPEDLRLIADTQRRLHPRAPRFVRLYVVETVYHLHDGVPSRPFSHTLVSWRVAR
jgi:hypothetical protein